MKGYVKDSGAQISDWRNFEWGQGKGLVERTRILWRGYGALVILLTSLEIICILVSMRECMLE